MPAPDWDLPAVPGPGGDHQDAGAAARAEIRERGGDRELVLEALADWVREKRLPETPDGDLVKFAHSCDYDLERAKKCVKGFYSVRAQASELFSGWDTELPNIRSILDVIIVAVMPRKTPDNYRVMVNSLQTPDTAGYVFADVCRVLLMVMESIFLTEPTIDGLVVVHDMGQASFAHFMKFGWALPKKLTAYTQDGLPLKQQTVHLVNCSGFIDKGLRLLSHLGRKEDWDRLSVHRGNDHGELHRRVPPECLPSDLGGTLPPLAELHDLTVRRLSSLKDIFPRLLP